MGRLSGRHVFTATTALAIALVVAVVAGLTDDWWPAKVADTTADRLAAVGVVFAGATFALAALAAVVALVAYEVSVRVPILVATVRMSWADEDAPVVALVPLPPADVNFVGFIRQDGDSMVTVRLHNRSNVSARNVALRLEMNGLLGWRNSTGQDPGLRPPAGAHEVRELGWEGGADYAIHGHQTREIRIDLSEMRVLKRTPVNLDLELFADGFHLKKRVPLELIPPDDYDERRTAQQDEILNQLAQEEGSS